jgi:tetratricopeptide (TPR) repeat protein
VDGVHRVIAVLVSVGLLALAPTGVLAAPPLDSSLDAPPGTSPSPEEIAELYERAVALERRAFEAEDADGDQTAIVDLAARAALLFERVGDYQGGLGAGYWRAARSTWLSGESLPLDDEAGRIVRFERALALADQGLQANPDCAECMLWKFISMGRVRTTRGIWEGVRQVPDMARLLERAIELEPTHQDGEDNSTLGNLHYSSAIFYRLLPDWFWIGWVLGVKGDKQRALEHARTALSLHPSRLDYQIEVATVLLCIGANRGKKEALADGRSKMEAAIRRAPANEDERREVQFARMMLAEPDRACGYTGDKLIEIDEDQAKKAKNASK